MIWKRKVEFGMKYLDVYLAVSRIKQETLDTEMSAKWYGKREAFTEQLIKYTVKSVC